MGRGGSHFSSEELVKVLSHYDIGVIDQVKPLSGGNRRAPKMVFISEQGKFLLKRRPRGKDDLYRVSLAHSVQKHLAGKGFPVTSLVATRDENSTILQLNNHIYELFRFVAGFRHDGSVEATFDVGRQLAEFHRDLSDFSQELELVGVGFHDSSKVRRYLRTVSINGSVAGGSVSAARSGADGGEQQVAKGLLTIYNESSIRVNRLGFDSWERQVVHGDWHPGNMLFSEGKLVAVLDFDSIRVAPAATDLSNGMLQFSIIGGGSDASEWPDHFDEERLVRFLNGYREVGSVGGREVEALVDLMIEAMIAEAVLPVAATGCFGNHGGGDFLRMIERKARWLEENRLRLTAALGG